MRLRLVVVTLLFIFLLCQLSVASDDLARCTKDGFYAALTEEHYSEFQKYIWRKDFKAAEEMVNAGLVVPLKPGLKVWLVDGRFLGSRVKVRLDGSRTTFWTNNNAIKRWKECFDEAISEAIAMYKEKGPRRFPEKEEMLKNAVSSYLTEHDIVFSEIIVPYLASWDQCRMRIKYYDNSDNGNSLALLKVAMVGAHLDKKTKFRLLEMVLEPVSQVGAVRSKIKVNYPGYNGIDLRMGERKWLSGMSELDKGHLDTWMENWKILEQHGSWKFSPTDVLSSIPTAD